MANAEEQLIAALNELSEQLDRDTVVELISVYSENSASQMAKIEEAAHKSDLKEINDQAHSLKSSSANMGAIELSEICYNLEKTTVLDSTTFTWIKSAHQLRDQAVQQMQSWKLKKSA